MHQRTVLRSALATMIVVALAAVPAVASAATTHDGTITGHPLVRGTDLFGMSEAEARVVIAAAYPMPVLAPLELVCLGVTRAVDASGAVALDVAAMVDEAYAASSTLPPAELTVRHRVDAGVVNGWITSIAAGVDIAAVDARYAVAGRSLVVLPSSTGRRVDAASARSTISAALLAEVAAGGAAPPAVTLDVVPVSPAITPATIPMALLVVLDQRRIYVYGTGGGLSRVYRCAIGMRRYPTPQGAFSVIGKQVMPAWRNPGSAWAKRMPRFIKPGPRNPLGTRALYLSAPGIRIHGTPQPGSIGRAASHGCVRMLRRDIEALYPEVPVGTRVFIVR